MGARWVLGRHRPGSTDGTRRHVVCHQPVRNARGLDWRARVGRDSTKRSGLLIRGFGVRVPGGALSIKALTLCFSPDRSYFHVHGGRLCARRVLGSQRTVLALGGLYGQVSTVGGCPTARQTRKCSCRYIKKQGDTIPWCSGDEYVFLGPKLSHFRRSNYSARIMRPASDGRYPGYEGNSPRPAMPVLVDMSRLWPGKPLPARPPVIPGQPYQAPSGRGIRRLPEDMPLASWLPVLADLTPHGLRHGHQTWMDEVNISYVLQSERMGHEVPGMRGIYSHVSPRMRATLVDDLQDMWETSLAERARLSPRSAVGALDAILSRPHGHRVGVG